MFLFGGVYQVYNKHVVWIKKGYTGSYHLAPFCDQNFFVMLYLTIFRSPETHSGSDIFHNNKRRICSITWQNMMFYKA